MDINRHQFEVNSIYKAVHSESHMSSSSAHDTTGSWGYTPWLVFLCQSALSLTRYAGRLAGFAHLNPTMGICP